MRINRLTSLALLVMLISTGCAFTNMGPPALKKENEAIQKDLTAVQAVEQYGVPDLIYNDNGRTYWVYRHHKGYFINLLYVSGGVTRNKDIQLEFEDGKLVWISYYPSGSAAGFSLYGAGYPGMIAE
jgi:hypothetical protein